MAGALTKRTKELREKLLSLRPGASNSALRNCIIELCAKNNYDPIQELINTVKASDQNAKAELISLAKSTKVRSKTLREQLLAIADNIVSADLREVIGIHKEVLQYIAPKLRSIETKENIDVNINVTVKKFSEEDENEPITIQATEEKEDGSKSSKE